MSKALAAILGLTATLAYAGDPLNVYTSGSTGADGPFAPEIATTIDGKTVRGSIPEGTRLISDRVCVPLPANGVFNFTTVNVPEGYRVCFVPNASNTPVTILATGDVTLSGVLSVDGNDTKTATLGYAPNDSTGCTIPGPGGYRGGSRNGAHGSYGGGPYGGNPDNGNGGSAPFCLPLVGGSGGGVSANTFYRNGNGGGGVLYLASSTTIAFGSAGSISFAPTTGGSTGAGAGMAALFANDIKGTPSSTDRNRMLLSAMRHEVYNDMSVYPMWHQGVAGPNVPKSPSVQIVKIGSQLMSEIPPGSMFEMPAPGKYTMILETRNLPANIGFNVLVTDLGQSGHPTSEKTYPTLSPTVEVQAGICQAKTDIDIASGEQRIMATATTPIQVASAPSFEGSRIKSLCLRSDSEGKCWVGFETEAGARLSYDAAIRLATEQHCSDFLALFAPTPARMEG